MKISGIFAMGGGYGHDPYGDSYGYDGFFYPYGGFHRAGFPDQRNGYHRPGYNPRYDQDSIYVKRYY